MSERILITGAAGSIGVPLADALAEHDVYRSDIEVLDVTNEEDVARWLSWYTPKLTTIYHLAADKHAPHGEEDPDHVARVNLDGTRNIVKHANGAKVILASTCKAANPETAYGASKLIAERLVLNAGGTVIRLYNVPETQGNVFRLWEQIPAGEPIPWSDCWRYFVPLDKAVELFVRALELPPGRYAPDPGPAQHMRFVAQETHPRRQFVEVPPRRGDRRREPLHGTCETVEKYEPGILRIVSTHDAEYAQAA